MCVGMSTRAAVSWHAPMPRAATGDDRGPSAAGAGLGGSPAEAPAELQGYGGWGALSVLVLGWCWLRPGSALRATGTGVTGTSGRRQTPPSLGRESGQSRGLATAIGAGHPGDITAAQPLRRLHHCWGCPRSAGSSLLKRRRSCHSLPGSSLGLSVPGTAQKRVFSRSCETAALSKSKQRCSLFQKGRSRVAVSQAAGRGRLLMAVVRGLSPEWLQAVGPPAAGRLGEAPLPAAAQARLSASLQTADTPRRPSGPGKRGSSPRVCPGHSGPAHGRRSLTCRHPACRLLQCGRFNLGPSAPPTTLGTALEIGPWGPLCPPSRLPYYLLRCEVTLHDSPLEHSKRMPGSHSPSRCSKGFPGGMPPGMFQRRAGVRLSRGVRAWMIVRQAPCHTVRCGLGARRGASPPEAPGWASGTGLFVCGHVRERVRVGVCPRPLWPCH